MLMRRRAFDVLRRWAAIVALGPGVAFAGGGSGRTTPACHARSAGFSLRADGVDVPVTAFSGD
jgi:hypothetical protein